MDNKVGAKNYFIIGLIFILVIIFIAIPFYINISKNYRTSIVGDVTSVGDGYIMVMGLKRDYKLYTNKKFNVGDKLSIDIIHVDKTKNPITGNILKATIVDENNESDISNSLSNEDDGDIISYFNTIESEIDSYQNDESKASIIKEGFVDIVDFIFYNKELKGVTFKELNEDTKLKILKIAFSIDYKVDNKFPGYKEEISRTGTKIYSDVRNRILASYLEITTKICSNNQELCNSAKDGLKDLKTSFSLTWDTIKSIAGLGTSKLRNWYEIWKEV